MLHNIPVQCVECVVDGMKIGDFVEVVPSVVSSFGIGKVGDVGASPVICKLLFRNQLCVTYGHAVIDTIRMPTIMALLTLYIIR